MANESYRGYLPLTEDERLLAEAYITPDVHTIGGSVTAKQPTDIGLLSATGGLNYQYDNKEFNPYAIGKLQGDNYGVQAAIDNYVNQISGNVGNITGSITNDPYGTTKSLGYENPNFRANVSKNDMGTRMDINALFNVLGGELSAGAYQDPYDKGLQMLFSRGF